MIDLGLGRISRLLEPLLSSSASTASTASTASPTKLPWRAVHIAGTNGKGSTAAYVAALLRRAHLRVGQFTSPHLLDRWDCIAIDDRPVSESAFRAVEAAVLARDRRAGIHATEFEILTATAFELFARERVHVGVIECGLGGLRDATNVLRPEDVAVCVVTKIGLDHQSFLGDTIEAIAREKAGILKPGVPFVVDRSNPPNVVQVIREVGREVGAQDIDASPSEDPDPDFQAYIAQSPLPLHQQQNLRGAYEAVKRVFPLFHLPIPPARDLLPAAQSIYMPGRLQPENLRPITGTDTPALVDGAHNAQSAAVLAAHVDAHLRGNVAAPVTWILAFSQGKDMAEIVQQLVRTGDSVVAVEFGPVDGMPWVRPLGAGELAREVRAWRPDARVEDAGRDVTRAMKIAEGTGARVVIAGSLYLVADVMRLLKAADPDHPLNAESSSS